MLAADDMEDIPAILRRTEEGQTDMAKRGRKPKNETEAKGAEAAPADNGAGHNANGGLTDTQMQALALQWKRKLSGLIEEKDSVVAKIRNAKKQIKAELGEDGVLLVEDMMKLETDTGEAELQKRMERAIRAAKYMAATLGTQFQLFEDRTPAADRAALEGKRDGMAGKTLHSPYAPGTPQNDAYIQAWHDGQKALFGIQKKEDGELFDAAADTPIGDQPATYAETTAH